MLTRLICLLAGLTIGFVWGRGSGWTEGEKQGNAVAPLELLAGSLQQGRCQLCGQPLATDRGSQERQDD